LQSLLDPTAHLAAQLENAWIRDGIDNR
jgi:hypothetical protein